MINLIDHYNQASWDLHYSLIRSGYDHPTVAINDDGFLPDDVTSPYLFYTGFADGVGQPLYFNQVPVPDNWEIRGDNSQGEIFNYNDKRGHIHYADPKHNRLVKAVDWYDRHGRHRVTDRYNKFGYRYAQTAHDLAGRAVLTSYFNREGQEVLVENHQTGDIILNEANQVHLFKNRTDFVTHYLRTAGFNLDRIIYNSLSIPFLVAFYMGGEGHDVLFWQEPIHDDIPGNMRLLLDGKGRKTTIVVQDKVTYEKMQTLLTPEQNAKVTHVGLLYPFTDKEKDHKQALILTNSDQLEGVEDLVTQLPNLHIHIGAITEMSSKLTALGQHPNVSLYPNIAMARVRELYARCGLYLDINHQGEILSAVRTAFEHQQLILAFEQTAHNRQYTADSLVFSSGGIAELISRLDQLTTDSSLVNTYLKAQKAKANLAQTQDYQRVLG